MNHEKYDVSKYIQSYRFTKIKVYDISGVRVKTADKRWNNLRHSYELTLTPTSVVRLVNENEENETIPEIHFDFVALRDISKFSNESFVGKYISK